ncbi:MAG: uroporphyrinogen-III synthase [Proteobacteria bacterium]|nr:uroporphyrinogen-III synthase [Pseudomonadota bacterium]
MRQALLTRAIEQTGESTQKLLELGWSAISLPLHHIVCLSPLHIDTRYKGLIITSQNAIPAMKHLSIGHTPSCYVVGSKSATALSQAGLRVNIVTPTAHQLLNEMLNAATTDNLHEPLLYLRGEEVKVDLRTALLKAGVEVEELPVYKTLARDALPTEVMAQVEVALFYSRKNSELFVKLVQQNPQTTLLIRSIVAIAISQDAAAALHSLPFKTVLVSLQPNEDSMLECLPR